MDRLEQSPEDWYRERATHLTPRQQDKAIATMTSFLKSFIEEEVELWKQQLS